MKENLPILLKNVKTHNLKGVDLKLNKNELIVFSGVSGSGKSSLAFDTIYVEGQRRYLESLSTHIKRRLSSFERPEADLITGLTPTIAIEQKTAGKNPRSTVGTMTEIYDFLRVLFSKIGIKYCPISKEKVQSQSPTEIIEAILKENEGEKLYILGNYIKDKKGEFINDLNELRKKGFTRLLIDGELANLSDSISLDKNKHHTIDVVFDRLEINSEQKQRLTESLMSALNFSKGIVTLFNPKTLNSELYSTESYSPKSGLSYPPLYPHDFSFNHPKGMCPDCEGLGQSLEFDLDLCLNQDLSIADDCFALGGSYDTIYWSNVYNNIARIYKFDIHTPFKDIPTQGQKAFLYGINAKWTRMQFYHPEKKKTWMEYIKFQGVLHEAKRRYMEAKSDTYRQKTENYMRKGICPSCLGTKIKPYPSHVQVGKKTITEICQFDIASAQHFFLNLKLTPNEIKIGKGLLQEICRRLEFLSRVGLHYLALERTAPTLSGGESQRVRLASQIGSSLVGTTYILDEPSIGLHPRDNVKLIKSLEALRDQGNTVIVVEHDEEMMLVADTIVDVGPGAGIEGGHILSCGSLLDLMKCKKSITADYLRGTKEVHTPKKKRKTKSFLKLKGAEHHNLKKIDVAFPLETMFAVTGVSGSGKSSLISQTLFPALRNKLHKGKNEVGKYKSIENLEAIDKVIAIDQSPIGRTPRSNPATYIKVLDEIRSLFAQLPDSMSFGFKAGRFSFNVKEGSCPHCSGMGTIKIDMDFMEDQQVVCPACSGKQFDPKTLSILYKKKSIYDVLNMSVREAIPFFEDIPLIFSKLSLLAEVGLEYIKLGQSSTTLSGGEAQRIKLAKELSRPETGKTLYILDEPTTGLHFHDIDKLLKILQKLVDHKNTVCVIEHNLDFIKACDYIIDIGPEGGSNGGNLLFNGPFDKFVKEKNETAFHLKKALDFDRKSLLTPQIKKKRGKPLNRLEVVDAEQNNLKKVSTYVEHGKITVCTGPSGSGKSSFAFDTIYAEGQRRYIESLSSYAKQLVMMMPKPKMESIDGLAVSIALEQSKHTSNPRSTLGTMTEIYDYLRVLFAKEGIAYCPETGEKLESITKEYVADHICAFDEKTKVQILSPIELTNAKLFTEEMGKLKKQGFLRIRLNGEVFSLEDDIPFKPTLKNKIEIVVDRLVVKDGIYNRLIETLETAARYGKQKIIVALKDKDILFNLKFAAPSTGKSYSDITPHTFSFNAQEGMCVHCQGIGNAWGANLEESKVIMEMTPFDLLVFLWKNYGLRFPFKAAASLLTKLGVDPDEPLDEMDQKELSIVLRGSKTKVKILGAQYSWIGIENGLERAALTAKGDLKGSITSILHSHTCTHCNGSRLNPLASNVKLGEKRIDQVTSMEIDQCTSFINKLKLDEPEAMKDVIDQIKLRLDFLKRIGLGYLSLDRTAPTLSGGEMQRIKLTRQLGSSLSGCLYVIDEPTIGLHPHNNHLLNQTLLHLKDLGNTLLLVEHDPLTLQIADRIIDFGPAAGAHGGEIISEGTLKQICNDPKSLTGQYLSGKKQVPKINFRFKDRGHLRIKGANIHNLKNLTVDIPIGKFTCITGVSGSGKSSLLHHTLKPLVKKYISTRSKETTISGPHGSLEGIDTFTKLLVVDQSPIGQTSRSDVSTYTELLTHLRSFFADLSESRIRGLRPMHFSFNHLKGMCRKCWGLGVKTIDLKYLPAVKMVCPDCNGNRLNPISLKVEYKGKNLGEILKLSIVEALEFLPPIDKLVKSLNTLISIGLGYLKLGQEVQTLSGGEAQRLRLAKELKASIHSKTLILLDEPTTGLHFEDISKLLLVFEKILEKKATLVVCEHNQELIRSCEHIIDLGPEAGAKGGTILYQGEMTKFSNIANSLTCRYLKEQ
ncbi:MAG: excinuclease ABC subunit UvrA [Rhabdochlamydiaceae bacterium]|nr:excinuclease ABC subunit UvrA [Candidatus Amphrikana amoebophyrae]